MKIELIKKRMLISVGDEKKLKKICLSIYSKSEWVNLGQRILLHSDSNRLFIFSKPPIKQSTNKWTDVGVFTPEASPMLSEHSPTHLIMEANLSLPECPFTGSIINEDIEEQQPCIGNVFSKSGSLRIFFHRGNHLLSGQWVGIPKMASICGCSFCVASEVRAPNTNSTQNQIWLDVKAHFRHFYPNINKQRTF